MCGRYVVDATPAMIAATFAAIDRLGDTAPRFNAAPSQLLPVVAPAGGEAAPRALELAQWGLVPERRTGSSPPILVNARAEALGRSPSHRSAFREGRCVVPATAFYEWAESADLDESADAQSQEIRLFDPGPAELAPAAKPRRRPKVPWVFRLRGGALFGLAAVSGWVPDAQGQARRCFAIVTTEPNELVAPVHDRMPLIVTPDEVGEWLEGTPEQALTLARPLDAALMETWMVSTRVNDVANDDPDLLAPAAGTTG